MMYLYFKAFHIITFVVWFAGMFQVFRLLAYQAQNKDNAEVTAVLKVMAKRMYKLVVNPAMVLTFLFGLAMIGHNTGLMKQGAMHMKITLVLILAGYTGFMGATRRRFENDEYRFSAATCRKLGWVPAVFLVVIILLMEIWRLNMG